MRIQVFFDYQLINYNRNQRWIMRLLSIKIALSEIYLNINNMNQSDQGQDQARYDYPASILKALKHGSTCTTGPLVPNGFKCPCCHRKQRARLSFCFDDKDTYTFGSSVKLFFKTYLFLATVLFTKFILDDFPRLINSPQVSKQSTFMQKLSISEFGYSVDVDVLNLASVFLLIVFFIGFRRVQMQTQMEVDWATTTENDYALFFTDLPKAFFGMDSIETTIRDQIQERLQRQLIRIKCTQSLNAIEQKVLELNKQAKVLKVEALSLCYNISKITHFDQVIHESAMEFLKLYKSKESQSKQQKLRDLMELLVNTKNEAVKHFEQDESLKEQISYFAGKVFVSFSYDSVKQLVIQRYEEDPESWNFQGLSSMKIERADNPSNICWQNMHTTYEELLKRRIISLLAVGMFVVYSAAIVFGLYVANNNNQIQAEKAAQPSMANKVLGIVISVFITVTNTVLDIIISSLVSYQLKVKVTDRKQTYIVYSFFAKFVNTSLISFLLQLFVYRNYFGAAGLAACMTQFILTNAVVSIATLLVDPPSIIRWIKIKLAERNKDEDGCVQTYQKLLNQLYELPEFPIESLYTNMLTVYVTVLFYSYLSPCISVIAALQFVLEHFICRYNFSQRYCLKTELAFQLNQKLTKYLELGIFLFALLNFAFPILCRLPLQEVYSFIGIAVSFAYGFLVVALPRDVIMRLLLVKKIETPDISYQEALAQHLLPEKYRNYNPASAD